MDIWYTLVKNGVAGVYDAVSKTIFHPVGNRLDAGPVKLGGGHAVGPVAHPATQWGRISYDADRKGMNDNSWMSISLPGYVAQGAGDIANLNGSNSSWQGENLKHSQLRFDGWFQVSADKAGVWNITLVSAKGTMSSAVTVMDDAFMLIIR